MNIRSHPSQSVLVLIAAGLCCVSIVAEGDEPYARGALFVFEPGGVVEGKRDPNAGVTIRTYAPTIAPGIGKTLRFFADANQPAAILVAAFDRRTGLLRASLPPLLSEQKEGFEALEFPANRSTFNFENDSSTELYVAVLALDDSELPKVRQLVAEVGAAVVKPRSAETSTVLKQQGEELRTLLDGWIRRANPAELVVRSKEPATAGAMRGGVIRWQEHATRFDIEEAAPTVRIFRIGPAGL